MRARTSSGRKATSPSRERKQLTSSEGNSASIERPPLATSISRRFARHHSTCSKSRLYERQSPTSSAERSFASVHGVEVGAVRWSLDSCHGMKTRVHSFSPFLLACQSW